MNETTAICTVLVIYAVLIAVVWLMIGHNDRGCYRGGHDDCSDEPPEEGSGQ